jgi:probable rRNA maturation factor
MLPAARTSRAAPNEATKQARKKALKATPKSTSMRSSRRAPARMSGRAPKKGPKIDMLVEFALWKGQPNVRSVVRRAIAAAAALLSTPGAELAIVLTDDSAIRLLNREWRGVDAATNVLSFPARCAAGDVPLIGDIVLAYETIDAEARADRKPFAHHVAHLAVHGFLHLLGYDHGRDKDAETMEQTERNILRRLAIPDPYRRPGKA